MLHYLVACLATPATIGRTLDIGGPDVLSYRMLMRIMAEERGLARRLVLPVPVLMPRLSSLWIHLVTPLGLGSPGRWPRAFAIAWCAAMTRPAD